jgi:hypothetical protein
VEKELRLGAKARCNDLDEVTRRYQPGLRVSDRASGLDARAIDPFVHEREPAAAVIVLPVFDRDEEPFGMVVIEGDFGKLVRSQVQHRSRTSDQALVIDHRHDVVLLQDCDHGQCGVGRPAQQVLPNWSDVKAGLAGRCDFVDESCEIYASCMELVPGVSALSLVLTAKSAL